MLLKKVNVTRPFVEISHLVCHIFVISFFITFFTSSVSFLITFMSMFLPFLISYRALRSHKSSQWEFVLLLRKVTPMMMCGMCYKHFALHSPKNFLVFRSTQIGPSRGRICDHRNEHSPVESVLHLRPHWDLASLPSLLKSIPTF